MENITKAGMSRRNFFGALGITAGAVGLAAASVESAHAEAPSTNPGRVGILFDGSACVGCHYCEGACRSANELSCAIDFNVAALAGTVYPKELLPFESIEKSKALAPVTEDDRDASRWLRVVQVAEAADDTPAQYARHSCTHCGKCAEVCPSGALTWRDEGIVDVNKDRCIGCKYCYQACPFDIPRFSEEKGDKTIRKCTSCAVLVDEGQTPACVEACPASALSFGTWDGILAKGQGIVARLQGEGYKDAVLYGEKELGGLGVLSVLPLGAKASGMPRIR